MRTVEDAILSETRILMDNIATINGMVSKTNNEGAWQLIEKVRRSEEKLSLVSTFFQISLYSNNMVQEDGQQGSTNRPAFPQPTQEN